MTDGDDDAKVFKNPRFYSKKKTNQLLVQLLAALLYH